MIQINRRLTYTSVEITPWPVVLSSLPGAGAQDTHKRTLQITMPLIDDLTDDVIMVALLFLCLQTENAKTKNVKFIYILHERSI